MPDSDGGLSPMPDNYYFNPALDADRALHPRAWTAAGSFAPEEIILRRRGNYERLARSLDGVPGANALHPQLPPGVCPLSFPLLVSNRDIWVGEFQARGIPAIGWWKGFHRGGIAWDEFPDACWLKGHVLSLPVHQGLEEAQMEYLCSAIPEVGQAVLR